MKKKFGNKEINKIKSKNNFTQKNKKLKPLKIYKNLMFKRKKQ